MKIDPYTFKCEEMYHKLNRTDALDEEGQSLLSKLAHFRESVPDCPSEKIKELAAQHNSRMQIYFDWDGEPMEFWEWVFKKECLPPHVADDTINNKRISTVWLGMNLSLYDGILIFETMIFETDDDESGEGSFYQERYGNYNEAEIGHKKACDLVRSGEVSTNSED